jgi:flagellar hook-associated protein 2
MPTITSSGVGSGLDVSSLVSQLVAAERAPLQARITRSDLKLTTELTAVGQLKGALSGFQTALTGLRLSDAFELRTTRVEDETSFRATATPDAAPGTYDIEVLQLATPARLASSAFSGPTAVVGTGTLTVAVGSTSFDVTLAAPANTLADVRDAINDATGNTVVRATLITGVDGTRLVLTGTATGTANGISVTAAGGNVGLDQLAYQPGGVQNLTVLSAAQDAIVRVQGFEARGATNSLDGVIEGVTLQLAEAEVGKITRLTVGVDDAGIRGKLDAFISAYNNVAKTIASLRSWNAETKKAGPLLGDSMLRSIEAQLRKFISEPVEGALSPYTTLASLGVTTNASGALEVSKTKFDAAMAASPAALRRLFTGETGLAGAMFTYIGGRLAADGEIGSRDASLAARRQDITKQTTALEARMVQIQARYQRQFNSLDTLLGKLQSTSSYLVQQLGAGSNNR